MKSPVVYITALILLQHRFSIRLHTFYIYCKSLLGGNHILLDTLQCSPVSAAQIQSWTSKDPVATSRGTNYVRIYIYVTESVL